MVLELKPNKEANELRYNFLVVYKYYVLFCYYVIKSAGEAANKVLLSVVWNPLVIEISLSQIRALDIKREKVCSMCPYLLFQIDQISINQLNSNGLSRWFFSGGTQGYAYPLNFLQTS